MTKYILVGGADKSATSEQKSALSQAIWVEAQRPPNILSVLFSRPREDWESGYDSFRRYFTELFGDAYDVQLAFPGTFDEQVKWADVIYIHGGDETLLAYWLSQYDLEKLFADKVVVGSSAGAEYLSAFFWTPDWREIKQGSALVNVSVIVHYSSKYGTSDPRGRIDWPAMRVALKATYPKLETHCIPEGEFVVVGR